MQSLTFSRSGKNSLTPVVSGLLATSATVCAD